MANNRILAVAHILTMTIVAKTADAARIEAMEKESPSKPVKRMMPP